MVSFPPIAVQPAALMCLPNLQFRNIDPAVGCQGLPKVYVLSATSEFAVILQFLNINPRRRNFPTVVCALGIVAYASSGAEIYPPPFTQFIVQSSKNSVPPAYIKSVAPSIQQFLK